MNSDLSLSFPVRLSAILLCDRDTIHFCAYDDMTWNVISHSPPYAVYNSVCILRRTSKLSNLALFCMSFDFYENKLIFTSFVKQ